MEISTLGPAALTGMSNVTSISMAPGPSPVAATIFEVEVPISALGNGLDTEANEPLPAHVANNAPAAVAAPPAIQIPPSEGGTGEPASLWAFGYSKSQGA